MSKVGRNELCPCGSGKKYKKCCESKAVDAATERARAHASAAAEHLAKMQLPPPSSFAWGAADDDGLDALSNSVIGLIREQHYDEALAVCERLRVEYPDVPDWLERSAMVHEARGETALAIDFYRRHLAFTELPEYREGFDEELREYFREKVSKLEASLQSAPPR